nr:3-hydroxyacyl-CoA dehydrogenase family protein [Denitromonas sp.]HQV14816.1 3-hydroxyacyl-CoA dehydrogenase family protein [Denitromonas sp.]
ELVDTVGLDIAVAAGQALTGSDAGAVPRTLMQRVDAGKLGKKTGEGFYVWVGGKAQKSTSGSIPAGLADRIIEPLLQAAKRCVQAGVVADGDLADAGVIFGTGFAPFSGGPIQALRTRGEVSAIDEPVTPLVPEGA